MAPEVMILLKQKNKDKKGYTAAVDWWSLGVTMFKLLTGHNPFPQVNVSVFLEWCTMKRNQAANIQNDIILNGNNYQGDYETFPEQYINFCRTLYELKADCNVSSNCLDIILKFLEVVEEKRLGYGAFGTRNVKSHPFLEKIQWDLLEQKHIIPPYIPVANTVTEKAHLDRLDSLLALHGKQAWLKDVPTRTEQKYFKNWYAIYIFIMCYDSIICG